MSRAPAACVFGLVSCTLGCSSAYIPQRGPRVSIVMDGGTLSYVRDGKKYDGGLFGGDIEEAVSGNARADAFAHDFKTGMETGFAVSMFGIASMIGGLTVGTIAVSRSESNDSLPVVGLVMLGAGAILDLVGAGFTVAAIPHLYDAVNAYNDGATQPGAPEASR